VKPVLSSIAVAACLLAASAVSSPVRAQRGMPGPKASPAASVTQTIGLTVVSVRYHRPAVKGRVVWGGLVPYGQVWRAGANENTTISFGTPVRVGGQDLDAGTYGLHVIPRPDAWTFVFSRNATSWGSYSYDASEDAARATAVPVAAEHQEWLSYGFEPVDSASAHLELRWARLAVPLLVEVDLTETILAETRDVYLRGLARWNPQAWQQAAQFCLDRGVNLEEAVTWADRAAQSNRSFTTVSLKAQILDALGRGEEAGAAKAEAWTVATVDELARMGGQLIASRRYDEAVSIFELAARHHPESWKAHDGLGEALRKNGDVPAALASYAKALELVADDSSRERIQRTIDELKGS